MLTCAQAASYLNISKRSVYNLASSGKLPFYRLGPRMTRFKQEDLETYIASCRASGSKAGALKARSRPATLQKETGLLESFRRMGVVPKLPDQRKRRSA